MTGLEFTELGGLGGASSPRHLCTGPERPSSSPCSLPPPTRLCTAGVALHLDHRLSSFAPTPSTTVSSSSWGNLTLGSILTGPDTHTQPPSSSERLLPKEPALRGKSLCVWILYWEVTESFVWETGFLRRSYPRYAWFSASSFLPFAPFLFSSPLPLKDSTSLLW